MTDIARLVLDADTSGLKKAERDLEKVGKTAGRTAAEIGKSMTSFGNVLTVGVSAPLAAFGGFAVKAASDATELQSAFDQTFGSMSQVMNDWAEKTGDAMGRSTQEMQRAANTFGIFFNQAAPTAQAAAEMSKEFAVLAQDLASFYNVDIETAINKLRSGLTGEAEPLRDFGVFLSEAAVQAKALEMGLGAAGRALTEQEKIQARYALILEGTANAQGDVARTSGSTANQIRAAQAAFEELQVVLGTRLLPVITPLIASLADAFTWFSQLPGPVQDFAMIAGGVAIAVGPLLTALGQIIIIAPQIATAFGAIKVAALGLMANPVILAFAGVLTAIFLAWQNWDKISPIIQSLGDTISGWWNDNVAPTLEAVGQALAKVAGFFADYFGGQIRAAVEVVSALMRGDFAGAWEIAREAVANSVSAAIEVFGAFAPYVISAVRAVYEGVRDWLKDRLGEVFDWVRGKIAAVTGAFRDMYVAVVGNSYVPDMVVGIGAEFARLQALMVEPAQRVTGDVTAAMQEMQRNVSSLLARLFPEMEEARRRAEDIALLRSAEDAGLISPQMRASALKRLLGPSEVSDDIARSGPLVDAARIAGEALDGLAQKAQVQTQVVAESFGQMADRAIQALDRMVGAIRGGGFLDILGSVINLGLQLGALGVFGKGVQQRINSAPRSYDGGGYTGSGARSGGLDGKGGFLAVLHPRETVVDHTRGQGLGARVQIVPSPYFDVVVDGRIVRAAPALANAGAMQAQGMAARSSRRRVR